jgi:uncharacterized protein (TIGR03437 family)
MRLLAIRTLITAALAASHLLAATFGTVVVIGGHASDLALDARRGQLYIANFAGKRIDVMSTANNQLRTPIRIDGDAVPGSIALSPDARYLVVSYYEKTVVSIIDIDAGTRSIVDVGATPLVVAFGNSSRALLVTSSGMDLLDPSTGTIQKIPNPPLECGKLPVPFATFPPQIVRASSTVSGNGQIILIVAESGASSPTCSASGATGGPQTMVIRYDTANSQLAAAVTTSSPPDGPRVVSTNRDASTMLVGWGLVNLRNVLLAEFPYPTGAFNVGSHAFDDVRNVIYAQIPSNAVKGKEPPVLHVVDTDNLTVRERLQIPENLAGKSVFSADRNTLYSISDSGVTVFPVGSLASARRVTTRQEQLLFAANNCSNGPVTATLDVNDPSGNATDFTLSVPSTTSGIRFSQTSGTTPARVTVEIDPSAFRKETGTTAIPVTITSAAGINMPDPVRLLVNTKEPDQRGAIYSLPGKIVDLLSDTARNRIYVLRQDRNQVLVLDTPSFRQIGVMRTGNTPTQMAFTRDHRYLIVGNDNSQIANVLDLETLQPSEPIVFPGGQYPRSIAAANSAMFGIARNVGKTGCTANDSPAGVVDRIDFANRTARLNCDELGIYTNNLPADSIMVASASGGSVFTAMTDGTVLLYNDGYAAFQASRKDATALAGTYEAPSDNLFVAGGNLFNASMVNTGVMPDAASLSGSITAGDTALTVGGKSIAGPGMAERVTLSTGQLIRPIRTIEAPITKTMLSTDPVGQIGQSILSFLRPMAQTADGTTVYLSVSGLTALTPTFDAPTQLPSVSSVVNLADGGGVASGSLIKISGVGLAAGAAAADSFPLPTTLGEMCAAVNSIPVPLIRVSPTVVEAQMPFEVSGNGTLVITSPGGKSAPFSVNVPATAAAVFRTGQAGDQTGLPLIYRVDNQELVNFSNPVHPGDVLVIYATGLGQTSPAVASGAASPSNPLATAIVQPTVKIGDVSLQINYAGLVPGSAGIYQINAVVPANIPAAREADLTIQQGSSSTTFTVRVVNP